jgi:hypothetical protein
MHYILNAAPFSEIDERGSLLENKSSPKLFAKSIRRIIMKVCDRQVVNAVGANYFFVVEEIGAATGAKLREEQGKEVL